MGLWLDVLLNTSEGRQATHIVLYKVVAIFVCIVRATVCLVYVSRLTSPQLVIPWMYLGWTSVRKESKVLMSIFILVSIIMLAGWGVMFISTTFSTTFMTWPFFAGISTASCSFTLMCTILGAICLSNFDKGLKNFRKSSPVAHPTAEC